MPICGLSAQSGPFQRPAYPHVVPAQVIVLTCHGREYADAGGSLIRLEDIAMSE